MVSNVKIKEKEGEKMRENKEREGKTVRFSIRLPKEEHEWLKARMEESRKGIEYRSINRDIAEMVRYFMEKK